MSSFVSMVDLPTQLLIEILSRLPVKSILICKCVCKLWLDLLSTTYFTDLYPSTTPTTLLLQPKDDTNIRTPSLFHPQDYTNRNANSMLTFKLGTNLPDLGLCVHGSCNGLLCLFDPEADDPVYICNPISREFITLPNFSILINLDGVIHHFGFGFSSRNNDQLKVIRIVKQGLHMRNRHCDATNCAAEIYTLGEGAWRRLGDVPKFPSCVTKNTFLNGTLHWDIFKDDSCVSFNFDTEQFGTVDGPQLGQTDEEKRSLGVLRGCLSVCNFDNPAQLEIWVMKEYGVKESWSKEYVVESTPDFILENPHWKPRGLRECELITVLESGEIMILFHKRHLVAYDPKLQCFRLLKPFSVENANFEAFPYVPNLVSLKDVVAGENIEVCTE